jgi:hypothetical protein
LSQCWSKKTAPAGLPPRSGRNKLGRNEEFVSADLRDFGFVRDYLFRPTVPDLVAAIEKKKKKCPVKACATIRVRRSRGRRRHRTSWKRSGRPRLDVGGLRKVRRKC